MNQMTGLDRIEHGLKLLEVIQAGGVQMTPMEMITIGLAEWVLAKAGRGSPSPRFETVYHPGTEPKGHPTSECASRGCCECGDTAGMHFGSTGCSRMGCRCRGYRRVRR